MISKNLNHRNWLFLKIDFALWISVVFHAHAISLWYITEKIWFHLAQPWETEKKSSKKSFLLLIQDLGDQGFIPANIIWKFFLINIKIKPLVKEALNMCTRIPNTQGAEILVVVVPL